MAKYIIAFVFVPLMQAFMLSSMKPQQWIHEIAGDNWVLVVIGFYYLVMALAFWLGYVTSRKAQ